MFPDPLRTSQRQVQVSDMSRQEMTEIAGSISHTVRVSQLTLPPQGFFGTRLLAQALGGRGRGKEVQVSLVRTSHEEDKACIHEFKPQNKETRRWMNLKEPSQCHVDLGSKRACVFFLPPRLVWMCSGLQTRLHSSHSGSEFQGSQKRGCEGMR